MPGVMTEIYSEEGNRIEKSMYDYHSGRMISLRMYSNTGADVKKLEFAEYTNMKADSCNKQLDSGKVIQTIRINCPCAGKRGNSHC